MFDTDTTALLRAVLEEVCASVSRCEIGARTHVAAKLLEAATRGQTSLDDLRQAGSRALSEASTMRG
ncbi:MULTISPECIES: hypothetical protein [unclassified Bradyrhizobium]|uniref:hypothetical protein n=1 Tax=unclassified Bradyrhizobium TaxID=2631580 RepID=UPI0002AAB935|nr:MULTISPECIES: hypothetical protein [unclassified Bradyrhizobium]AMA57479.1 hypothetical protein BCCGELA001_15225 [Bradyrhizobium sp. CCGE-LA001]KYH00315.1 hypothetical protein SE91_18980 [Bradyrhizobium sp. DOA1]